MFDPEGKRGKTIDKRREEHKARRGVKGAKVPAYKVSEDYETKKKEEIMGALKKRDLKQKVKEKIAADIIKRKGDVSKSDDRYAYESVEVVTELEKKTLGNYVKKASTDLATRSIKHGMTGGTETGGDPDSSENVEKINKRHSGIMKAVDKLKKEGFSNWRETLDEKCWKGYEKKGMKTMFGKRYPNCVKKKTKSEEVEFQEKLDLKKADMGDVVKDFYKSDAPQFKGRSKEKRREMAIAAKLTAERGKLPEDYSANPAQQAAIAIAKKERKQDLKVAQKKKMKEEIVTELNRFEKEKGVDTKTGKPVTKGGTAKNDKAFQFVMKKVGKQRMGANQPKKVRGAKNPNETSPTKQKMTRMKAAKASSRAFETRAKRAGYKTAQDYANVVARYGSEDNMKKGRGLGT
jgi:hypothetical protein